MRSDRRRVPLGLVALLGAAVLSGCIGRALEEYVARRPEPVSFGCEEPTAGAGLDLGSRVLFAGVRDGRPGGGFAGHLPGGGIAVPFDPTTAPPDVLGNDIRRLLSSRGVVASPGSRDSALRLDVVLLRSEAVFRDHLVRGGAIVGMVAFDFSLVAAGEDEVLWYTRAIGRHEERPVYATSRDYQRAVNGAYCAALRELAAWLDTLPLERAAWDASQ